MPEIQKERLRSVCVRENRVSLTVICFLSVWIKRKRLFCNSKIIMIYDIYLLL